MRLSRRRRVTFSLLVQRKSNQKESTPEWRETPRLRPAFGTRAAPRGSCRESRRTHPCARPLRGANPNTGRKRARHTGFQLLEQQLQQHSPRSFASNGTPKWVVAVDVTPPSKRARAHRPFGEKPAGSPPWRAATFPRGMDAAWESVGPKRPVCSGAVARSRGACFFGYFLCTSKESTSPAVREPQLIIY